VSCFFLVEGNPPGLLEEPSKRKKRLPLSILVPLISVFALICTITGVYVWRRKMAEKEGNGLAFHNAHHAQSRGFVSLN